MSSATTKDIVLNSGPVRFTPEPVTFNVAAAATTIYPGDPVAMALGAAVVTRAATATPVVGTDYYVGIAAAVSTQTASAAGSVDVYPLMPGVTYIGTPTTPANFDTQAEYDARVGRRVDLTLTGSTFTVNDTDGATNGLVIMALDITQPEFKGKVAFAIRNGVNALS